MNNTPATVANAVFGNVINNASNSAGSGFNWWVAAGMIALFAIAVYAYYWFTNYDQSPWYSERTKGLEQEFEKVAGELLPSIQPEPVLPGKNREAWCFVAEDLTGRWCVRVPSKKSCEPARTFETRESCELTPGSRMPAAVVRKGGEAETPLRDMHIQ